METKLLKVGDRLFCLKTENATIFKVIKVTPKLATIKREGEGYPYGEFRVKRELFSFTPEINETRYYTKWYGEVPVCLTSRLYLQDAITEQDYLKFINYQKIRIGINKLYDKWNLHVKSPNDNSKTLEILEQLLEEIGIKD